MYLARHEVALSEGRCDLLNRTQGSQRGFLRLGESLHSCDIEPFVGPVAPQRPQQLATFEVPHLDGTVIAATGQPGAIGADRERLNRSLVRFSQSHALPTSYVPPAQHPIAVPTNQQRVARAPLQGQHTALSRDYGVQALPTTCIPQEHLAPASMPLVPATTGEPG